MQFFFHKRILRNIANVFVLTFASFFILVLPGCGDLTDALKNPEPTGSESATVTWDENRDTGVNSAGGGYRVYYASSANTATASNPKVVLVPYVSGATAPTTATISNLTTGDWYIKVVAYSAYNPHNISGGAKSSDSNEFKITIQ